MCTNMFLNFAFVYNILSIVIDIFMNNTVFMSRMMKIN